MQMYVYYVSWASVVILATWRKSYCPNFNNACAMPVVREMMQYSEACDQWLFCHCSDNPLFLYFLCHPYIFSILYEIFNLLYRVSCLQFVTAHLSHVCMHSSAYSCMSSHIDETFLSLYGTIFTAISKVFGPENFWDAWFTVKYQSISIMTIIVILIVVHRGFVGPSGVHVFVLFLSIYTSCRTHQFT